MKDTWIEIKVIGPQLNVPSKWEIFVSNDSTKSQFNENVKWCHLAIHVT